MTTTLTKALTFEERAGLAKNAVSQRLLRLMGTKKTNLAVNADVTSKDELLRFAELLGPEICVMKTHVDMLEDFDRDFTKRLQEIAEKHEFLIFEDRKFADIGHIVKHQYSGGVYQIADWAHITNAHTVPGEGVIEGLKQVGLPLGRGLLLLAEMSSAGSLANGSYTQATVTMAENHEDFVMGFISQGKLSDRPGLIHFTPGVNLASKGDSLGQQYKTPESVVGQKGTDIIIVGRGIITADDPRTTAQAYRQAAWDAYQNRCQ